MRGTPYDIRRLYMILTSLAFLMLPFMLDRRPVAASRPRYSAAGFTKVDCEF